MGKLGQWFILEDWKKFGFLPFGNTEGPLFFDLSSGYKYVHIKFYIVVHDFNILFYFLIKQFKNKKEPMGAYIIQNPSVGTWLRQNQCSTYSFSSMIAFGFWKTLLQNSHFMSLNKFNHFSMLINSLLWNLPQGKACKNVQKEACKLHSFKHTSYFWNILGLSVSYTE